MDQHRCLQPLLIVVASLQSPCPDTVRERATALAPMSVVSQLPVPLRRQLCHTARPPPQSGAVNRINLSVISTSLSFVYVGVSIYIRFTCSISNEYHVKAYASISPSSPPASPSCMWVCRYIYGSRARSPMNTM